MKIKGYIKKICDKEKRKRLMEVFKIGFIIWFIWFLINFVITPLPIVIAKFFPNTQDRVLFSSYLTYIFSLLVVSASVLYFHFRKESTLTFSDIYFWITILILIVIGMMYVFYNLQNNDISKIIDENMKTIFWVSIIIVFIISVLLYWSFNKERISSESEQNKIKEIDNIKKDINSYREQIEREGI